MSSREVKPRQRSTERSTVKRSRSRNRSKSSSKSPSRQTKTNNTRAGKVYTRVNKLILMLSFI